VIRSGEVEERASPALSGDHPNVDSPVYPASIGLLGQSAHAHVHISLFVIANINTNINVNVKAIISKTQVRAVNLLAVD
jgi:hypothetical protein